MVLTNPNGGEMLLVGRRYTINWQNQGDIGNVKIEYSDANGASWKEVVSDTNNSGSYDWLVPVADSNQCLVRISDASDPNVSDVSDSVFKIYECALADVSGDCVVDFFDFALMAADWLKCGDPFDANCVQ